MYEWNYTGNNKERRRNMYLPVIKKKKENNIQGIHVTVNCEKYTSMEHEEQIKSWSAKRILRKSVNVLWRTNWMQKQRRLYENGKYGAEEELVEKKKKTKSKDEQEKLNVIK